MKQIVTSTIVLFLTVALEAIPLAPVLKDTLPVSGIKSRSSLSVNTKDKKSSYDFYKKYYLPSSSVSNGWNGSVSSCKAGNNSSEYNEATLQRVNYFRALAGVPADLILKEEYNAKALAAALIMEANNTLTHHPSQSMKCYSADGYKGASSSNIALGASGPSSIDLYMEDPGSGNYFVGHRRWILNLNSAIIGTGSTARANALYVFGEQKDHVDKPKWIAWPPAGYVPSRFGLRSDYRWSITFYDNVNASNLNIKASISGKNMPVTMEKYAGGYGSGTTVVWKIGFPANIPAETEVAITINGAPDPVSYTVNFFDPSKEPADVQDVKKEEIKTDTEELNKKLIQAVYEKNSALVAELLKKGAKAEATFEKWPALHLATYFNDDKTVKVLLQAGADPYREVDGWTAFDIAEKNGLTHISEILGPRRRSMKPAGKLPALPVKK